MSTAPPRPRSVSQQCSLRAPRCSSRPTFLTVLRPWKPWDGVDVGGEGEEALIGGQGTQLPPLQHKINLREGQTGHTNSTYKPRVPQLREKSSPS